MDRPALTVGMSGAHGSHLIWATEGAHRFSGNVISFHKWQHRADIVGVNIDFLTCRFTHLKVFKIGGSRFLLLFLVNIIVKKSIFMQTSYLGMLCHATVLPIGGPPCVSSKELLMSDSNGLKSPCIVIRNSIGFLLLPAGALPTINEH